MGALKIKTHRYLIIILLFMCFCCISVIGSQKEDPNTITGAAGIIAQAFIWEVADVPALCKDLNLTPAELKIATKAEFYKLATADKQPYQEYLTIGQSEDEQKAVLKYFLNEYSRKSPSLDFVSSFLVWKIFYTRCDEVTTFKDGPKYRKKKYEDRINVKNFCLNALTASSKSHEIPAVFQKAKKQMSAQFWDIQGWHNAYPIASKIKDLKAAWWWVNSSLNLLQDAATITNHELDSVIINLSIIYSSMLSDRDERHVYSQLRIAANSQKLLASLDKSILMKVNSKYPSLDWKSPASFGLYWCEYGLNKVAAKNSKLQRHLYRCFKDCCLKGHVNIISNHASPLWIFKTPNFELFSKFYETMYDSFTSNGMKKQMADRSIKHSADQLLLACYQFNRNNKGEKIYSKLKKSFPKDSKLSNNYSDYMLQLMKDNLSQMDGDSIAIEIYTHLRNGYSLIAVGETGNGNSLLRYSELEFKQALNNGHFKGYEFKILRKKVFISVLNNMPESHKLYLNRWKQKDSLKGLDKP